MATTNIEMSEALGIGKITMYALFRQFVQVINRVLGYLMKSQGGDTLQHSMVENERRYSISNVVGAIDCIHLRIVAPNNDIKFVYLN